jgi:thioredoxin reductase
MIHAGGGAPIVAKCLLIATGAVFLAEQARQVLLVIRGDDLNTSMSAYLARRIEQTANIEVPANTMIRRIVSQSKSRIAAPRRNVLSRLRLCSAS